LSGVTNHLEVAALLLRGHCELVPDVHPVTILAVNALATNLNLNLGNELLAGVIQPTSVDARAGESVGENSVVSHVLVDLGKSNLKVCAVSKITISADNACNAAAKIGLSIESLLNRLNRKVCVSAVCNFPKSNLRVTCTFPLPHLSMRIRLYLKKNSHLI